MLNKILFVFEGQRPEKIILQSLCNNLFNVKKHLIVECVFDAEIYQLYAWLKKDEYIDTFEMLKGKVGKVLDEYERDDFAEIYLFFDYDGHASTADNYKIMELLTFFNNETEKGKLFVSYPMVEAIKHIVENESFQHKVVPCKIKDYKSLVNTEASKNLKDFRKYDINIWKLILRLHLYKMNYIVNDVFDYPLSVIQQDEIFKCQYDKYISPSAEISVLSAFPLFIHYYFGHVRVLEMLSK